MPASANASAPDVSRLRAAAARLRATCETKIAPRSSSTNMTASAMMSVCPRRVPARGLAARARSAGWLIWLILWLIGSRSERVSQVSRGSYPAGLLVLQVADLQLLCQHSVHRAGGGLIVQAGLDGDVDQLACKIVHLDHVVRPVDLELIEHLDRVGRRALAAAGQKLRICVGGRLRGVVRRVRLELRDAIRLVVDRRVVYAAGPGLVRDVRHVAALGARPELHEAPRKLDMLRRRLRIVLVLVVQLVLVRPDRI